MFKKNKIIDFLKIKDEPKIIGREAFLNSAVMVLFCEINGEIQVLFEKRALNIRQGGEVSFPGGRKDENDINFMVTALRETYEEIGLSQNRIKNIRKYGTIIIPTGVVVEVYLGYVENFSMEEIKINSDEVERIIMVPLKFFLETEPEIERVTLENLPYYEKNGEKIEFPVEKWGLPERYKKPWRGTPRRMLFYSYKGDTIWGITGEIIYSISKEILNKI